MSRRSAVASWMRCAAWACSWRANSRLKTAVPWPRTRLLPLCSKGSGGGPAAIFAASDGLAAALQEQAFKRGLQTGKDILIMGYGDHGWTAAQQLSTVHIPAEQMGRAAAQLLLEQLGGYRGQPRVQRFEPRLALRASC
ncbi:substrate-binding domain-containing protein [Deinococcus lacus]|uniref:Substrate-binding domain-containing protein n=1 Tax=Deinococcus lacus TaxID=392561 RepID=A0ABW1YHJ7_9DEIO